VTGPNNSFKPKPLRYSKSVAEKSCHACASTTRFGLTQVFGNLRETIMPISWEQPDIFPAIARIIAHSFESSGDFVTHETIVAALLNDSEAAPIIAHATEQSPEPHTSDWMAHNMAAWFSQRITVGGSDWAQRFERTKINGKWAYRPKSSSAS